jgi:hypothetical protein
MTENDIQCPACEWHYEKLSGHFYEWHVMGDPRTTVEVCEPCHRAQIEHNTNH